jgi:hypothetical protein
MLDPIFAPITFDFDLPGRRAKILIPGVLETENEPIRNPVTGAPHRIQIVMPEGFEHRRAEVCSARIASTGGIWRARDLFSGGALSYQGAPKAGAPRGRRGASAEVRPRDRMNRHRNAFRSAIPCSHRSKLTRTERKIRVSFFRV